MATTEHTINDAIASLLRSTRAQWRGKDVVSSENTGLLKGSSGRPDILVAEPNVSPVVVETEVAPAGTVEREARGRLGEVLATSGRTVMAAIAVRLPVDLRQLAGQALAKVLEEGDELEFAALTQSEDGGHYRWPSRGWLKGGIPELSRTIQSVAVPAHVIEAAADWLVDGVSEAAGLLGEIAESHPDTMARICLALKQEDSEQTRRMAMTIVADALLFHEMLAGSGGELAGLPTLEELRDSTGKLSKPGVLESWRRILEVNYWPIFDIARRTLATIPSSHAGNVLDRLVEVTDKLAQHQLTRSHDLTGAIFQKLIADRKFLAAYYTTPASAALLAGLVSAAGGILEGDGSVGKEAIGALRIADFACGTGTLLSTVYQLVRREYELAGGDSRELHAGLMAEGLVGCDVMPAAAHLTASMLSSAHPTTKYERSAIMTVSYGRQPDGSVALGSLDLLEQQSAISVLAGRAMRAEGTKEVEVDPWVQVPAGTFDVVIMNPPFTRPTGHEGAKIGVPVPMFAAFGSDTQDQRAMAKAMAQLTKGTCYHGNAGEASAFLALGDRKLKVGGVLGMVMPLSLMAGKAWEASRQLLRLAYDDVTLVTIAAARTEDTSFSADTGMGECLVIGRKSGSGEGRGRFLILERRPASAGEAWQIARSLKRVAADGRIRRLEDGPVGGTPIGVGTDVVGVAIEAPLQDDGWRLSRVADVSLAQCAHQLASEGRVWLPGMGESGSPRVVLARAGEIGQVGPYHMDISGTELAGGAVVRGPFDIAELSGSRVPTYPVLWRHASSEQQTMLVGPDSEAVMRSGTDKSEDEIIRGRAARIAGTAAYCHFNRDFRFNSQSTAFCFTDPPCIGGRAWPSLSVQTKEQAKAIVLWGNCTLGLLLYWWFASKQQSGRGTIPITVFADFPVLDVTQLPKSRLRAAVGIFGDLAGTALKPMNELESDEVRRGMDRRVWIEVLGLNSDFAADGGPLDLLRRKLGQEPSIAGGKK